MTNEYTELIGKSFISVKKIDDDELVFTSADGSQYVFCHEQDCCEDVTIEDIIGDLDDLVDTPILMAEEVVHQDETPKGISLPDKEWLQDSYTWTFYKFATIKGYVTVRWYGESNGYYSESVDFRRRIGRKK